MTRLRPLLLLALLVLIQGHSSLGDRESECIEVGFARSAGSYLHKGYEAAKEALLERWATEDKEGKPTYGDLTPLLKNVTRTGHLLEEASQLIVGLVRKTRVGKRCIGAWILKGVEKHVIPLINLDKELAESMGLVMSFRCLVGSPYPQVDGSCVNQESPDLGSVGSKFLRLQTSTMSTDGFSLRGSVKGGEVSLPSARDVARLVRKHIKRPPVTEMFTQWAHFVQRDTFSIPESPLAEDVDCCANPEAEDCAPIPVAEDDPIHSTLPCINYRRSARAQAILGHRESLSLVSTYLDASPVYGTTDKIAFTKKSGYFGYLKAHEAEDDGGKKKKVKKVKCAAPESLDGCFDLDDGEDWAIGLQSLLVLEHNRIADALLELNSHFDDSLLYNEARRILIAEYAHITFGEYLQVLLGKATQEKHSLQPGAEGHAASFIPEVNPGILASFAVSSYRNPAMQTEWKSEWGKTDILESTHYNSIRKDPYQDLLAMDIQRSRDHGVAGYKVWRQFCDSEGQYNSWDDFVPVLGQDTVDELKELYQDELDDLDAVMGVLEAGVDEDAVAGKTYTCLLADQFARLKTGNRLYWEHESSMLTQEQKDYVKGVTLAHLLCNNFHLTAVPKNSFLPPSDSNPLVPCSKLPLGVLSAWEDTSLIEKMKEIREAEAAEETQQAAADKPTPSKAEPKEEL